MIYINRFFFGISNQLRRFYLNSNIYDKRISQINNIINQGHKLVLVYPVPEMGGSPYRYLFRNYIVKKNLFNKSIPIFSGSHEVYKKRNKLIFEILDFIIQVQ